MLGGSIAATQAVEFDVLIGGGIFLKIVAVKLCDETAEETQICYAASF